jgi:opacity protein-like surface antigen
VLVLKKNLTFLLFLLIFLFTPALTLAAATDATWEISVQGWDCRGAFDYYLSDSSASQVVSKVSFPQDQRMIVANLKYIFPDDFGYLKIQYGQTGANLKGRGSDSDWTATDASVLTYYGELDSYGSQQLLSLDFGKTILENELHSTSVFVGWGQKETTNELKNVIYYLVNGVSLSGGQSQDDLGSTLDGEFSEIYLGVNDQRVMGRKFTLNTELAVSLLHTKAYGCWNNHSPAWEWTDTGDTIGYRAKIGLQYEILRQVSLELGYYYSYFKATNCEEVLNGALLSQPVDLKYQQRGLYLGINLRF